MHAAAEYLDDIAERYHNADPKGKALLEGRFFASVYGEKRITRCYLIHEDCTEDRDGYLEDITIRPLADLASKVDYFHLEWTQPRGWTFSAQQHSWKITEAAKKFLDAVCKPEKA